VIKEMTTTYLIIDAETTSLDPSENGRVTCISTCNIDNNQVISFTDLNEEKVLGDFWDYIDTLNCPTLVTFNGAYFDMPYIIHRSIVKRQIISRYKLLDLRQTVNSFFLSYDKRAKGNLAYWAAVLGIQQHTPPGSQMIALFIERKLDEIKCHCEEDILITKALFERCREVGLIEGNGNQNVGKH
jgi:uncharacterized protein YprB with RNaseH-like and TPR domain